jgi:four helix bundle protein
MTYAEWEASVPVAIRNDVLWTMQSYRKALFVGDIGWQDVTTLIQDKRTVALADQLYRALGSISANLAEGYSRSSGRDRARFFEYALGSAREARDWYHKAIHVLGKTVVSHRIELLTEIIRLLIKTIPNERKRGIREDGVAYIAQEMH